MIYYELMIVLFILQLGGCYLLWRIIKKRSIESSILKELKPVLATFIFVLLGQLLIIAIITYGKIRFG
jgi:hypothetical protein